MENGNIFKGLIPFAREISPDTTLRARKPLFTNPRGRSPRGFVNKRLPRYGVDKKRAACELADPLFVEKRIRSASPPGNSVVSVSERSRDVAYAFTYWTGTDKPRLRMCLKNGLYHELQQCPQQWTYNATNLHVKMCFYIRLFTPRNLAVVCWRIYKGRWYGGSGARFPVLICLLDAQV